jgi:hypothetical protein
VFYFTPQTDLWPLTLPLKKGGEGQASVRRFSLFSGRSFGRFFDRVLSLSFQSLMLAAPISPDACSDACFEASVRGALFLERPRRPS